jgi:hypothetical protein
MSKHTPAPWSFHPHMGAPSDGSGYVTKCRNFDAHTVHIGAGEILLASVEAYKHSGPHNGFPRVSDFDENRANARLMCAAPELLEALKRAEEFLAHSTEYRIGHPGFEQANAQARAAIVKAEGTAK